MVTRRNFLKGMAAAPVVIAVAPSTLATPTEETSLLAKEAALRSVQAKAVAMSRLSSGVMVSGGWCAPLSPHFELPVSGKPVRDSLPTITL